MKSSLQRVISSATKCLLSGSVKTSVAWSASHQRRFVSSHNPEEIEADKNPLAANWRTRCELAACYRILHNLKFDEGVCNHLSASCAAKDGSGKIMLTIPYGLSWREVTASSLVGVSLNDPRNPTVIEKGYGDPDISAVSIHNGIHHSRPDLSCVLHSHVPNVTALTCLKDQALLMCHQNSTRFLGEICYDNEYDGMATALDEGFRLGKVLGQKHVMMMGNHGVLVLGRTVAEAFDQLYYLERAAEVQILAMSTGKELSIIPENLAKMNKEFMVKEMHHYSDVHFQAMCRLIKSEVPSYES